VFVRLRWPQTDRQASLSTLLLRSLLRLPPFGEPAALALQGHADPISRRPRATVFAWHKLPLRTYLMAAAVFCNEVKGKSMLALFRDLDVQYKTAFVLAHKLREAMASSLKALRIGGEGRTSEVDGVYFCGHIRRENLAADRIDRPLAENQSGKRRVVVAMRERGGAHAGESGPGRGGRRLGSPTADPKGTTVHADESPARNTLHSSFAMQRITHQEGYCIDGALHQWRRILFLPLASRRTRTSPPHCRAISCSLGPGGRVARGPPARR
jgi:hypothetical protein